MAKTTIIRKNILINLFPFNMTGLCLEKRRQH